MASCGRVALGLSGAATGPTDAQAHATKRRVPNPPQVANLVANLPHKGPAIPLSCRAPDVTAADLTEPRLYKERYYGPRFFHLLPLSRDTRQTCLPLCDTGPPNQTLDS